MNRRILTDGRMVRSNEECSDLRDALNGVHGDGPQLFEARRITLSWYLQCQCCGGGGVHSWSPSSYFNGASGPDSGEYVCEPCEGYGEFVIKLPSS